MLRIKLIQPKMECRQMDTAIKSRMAPPLGLLTVASILRNHCEVSIENENISNIDFKDNPDIVGITVTVDILPRAVDIAKKFREKGCTVVAGGIHITTALDMVLQDSFDVLCIGMAEGTWPQIVRDYENGCLKSVYRCSDNICGADIVSPAYDMLRTGEYLYCNIVHTSRGCPFRCDFCYNSSNAQPYLNRPIDDVLKDIRAIHSKHIMFIDDNIIGNPEWTMEFVQALKPMNIKWNAAASANILNMPTLLDEMKESGCESLFIGFESISPESLSGVHKVQNDSGRFDELVEALHSRGIMINGSFVFGLDGDTKETFQATLGWIVEHRIETVTSHILTPYPGTKLYDRLKEDGRITTDNLALYNTANVVFEPNGMTADELYQGYLWIYKQVYSFKNIIKRIPRTHAQIAPYLMFNLFYRKFGSFTDRLCRMISYERIGRWGARLSHYL